jgi:capsular exopolysaccharide synthesis family protein
MSEALLDDLNVIDNYDGESAAGTEFRRLLHNLLTNSVLPEEGRSFLITSAMTGEGKSTIASYLAVTAAIYKLKRTLIVDADMRKPTLHKRFGVKQEGGLTDILEAKAKLEDNFKKTPIENLSILTSGTAHSNPTRLFDSQEIHEVMRALKFYFDLIIIDCAPIIPVSDPLLLSRDVDGILIVLKAGETPKEVARRACDIVHEAGANLLGVTLNNVREALPYYYNHRYYGYNYAAKK